MVPWGQPWRGLAQADRVRDEPRYLETDDEEKKPSTRLHSSPTLFEEEAAVSRVSGQRIVYSALAPPHSRRGQALVKQSINESIVFGKMFLLFSPRVRPKRKKGHFLIPLHTGLLVPALDGRSARRYL